MVHPNSVVNVSNPRRMRRQVDVLSGARWIVFGHQPAQAGEHGTEIDEEWLYSFAWMGSCCCCYVLFLFISETHVCNSCIRYLTVHISFKTNDREGAISERVCVLCRRRRKYVRPLNIGCKLSSGVRIQLCRQLTSERLANVPVSMQKRCSL